MNHEILYDQSFALAVVTLKQGERIMAESGAMVSMSPTIQLDAKMSGGGMMGAVKSAMGGESLYRTTFRAETGPGEVTLAPAALGDIMAVELTGQKFFVQPGSYLAGDVSLSIDLQGSARGMFSGEGYFCSPLRDAGCCCCRHSARSTRKNSIQAKSTSLTPGISWHLKTPCSGGSRRRPVRRRASAVS